MKKEPPILWQPTEKQREFLACPAREVLFAGSVGSGKTVHRKFKTLIVQTENGEFRLSKEFGELDCDALEDYVRVCPPPPYGLCFQRSEFGAQLSAAIAEFHASCHVMIARSAIARLEWK